MNSPPQKTHIRRKVELIGPKLGSQQDTPKIPTGYGENTYPAVVIIVINYLPTPKKPIFAVK